MNQHRSPSEFSGSDSLARMIINRELNCSPSKVSNELFYRRLGISKDKEFDSSAEIDEHSKILLIVLYSART